MLSQEGVRMNTQVCIKQCREYLYSKILKLENEILKTTNQNLKFQLINYKKISKIRYYALENAVSKIVDNCKYCVCEYKSTACRNSCCKKNLCKYFINNAKLQHLNNCKLTTPTKASPKSRLKTKKYKHLIL